MLVPLLPAALLTAVRGGDIGDDLRGRALTALKGAGLDGVDIDASGRDLTLTAADGSALSGADAERARDLVADVDGVRVASLGDGFDGASAGSDDTDATEEPTSEPSETEEATESASAEPTAAGGANCEVSAAQAGIDKALGADFVQFGELRRIPDDPSKAEIAAVAELIAPCTDLAVTVTGYTDKFGSKKLSLARAINVTNLLTEAGVTSDISKVGGHFTRELGDNETCAGGAIRIASPRSRWGDDMAWLFGQLWFLLLLAFVIGAPVAWLGAKVALPHVDELEAETGLSTDGVL
ncbi:OmpA family protein [Nocardioides sp. B-3]|uniref:OmpA family protein n=1 Tax=Nocardioides sp. B-3 TaxID=2895565 RepID=UPI002152F221|nr:OmpA family protein [Nocardioides sp. B-3]UUZ57880.1 OmpA family protein [Nocardioides sp. B-3]